MTLLDPARVSVLVVAVECYAVGTAWRLDGPAADAGRFVGWVRRWGVPDERITLLASTLPANAAALAALGLPVAPAEQSTVRAALTGRLRQAEQLLVFWGGHGVVDGRDTRRLFYADATADDKRNLDVSDLLVALRSTYFPRCDRQLVVVDACQNLVEELRLVHRLPSESLPAGAPVAGRQQHVLFAASPGEVAVNDDARRTGVFSDALLRELDTAADLPEPAALHARLTERLTGGGRQHPMHLWHRGPHQEGVLRGGPPPANRPTRLDLRSLTAITDVMLDVDELADVPNLRMIVGLLPPDVRGAVPFAERPRTFVINVLRTCDNQIDGRSALVAALRLGMADPTGLARVLAALDEHWPG